MFKDIRLSSEGQVCYTTCFLAMMENLQLVRHWRRGHSLDQSEDLSRECFDNWVRGGEEAAVQMEKTLAMMEEIKTQADEEKQVLAGKIEKLKQEIETNGAITTDKMKTLQGKLISEIYCAYSLF